MGISYTVQHSFEMKYLWFTIIGALVSVVAISGCGSNWGKYRLSGDVSFKMGDHVLESCIPVPFLPLPPSHVMFAISESRLLHIERTKENSHRTVPYIKSRDSLRNESPLMAARVIQPDPNYGPLVIEKGAVIARRMVSIKLYYHLQQCNCNHYADYFTYGRTFGAKWKVWYQPMNKDCPLYTRLDEDTDAETVPIVNGHGKDMRLPKLKKKPSGSSNGSAVSETKSSEGQGEGEQQQ